MISVLSPSVYLHLLIALIAGGVIGLERTYHGRPAGFRTHVLVCVASTLLMMLTLYQAEWFAEYSSGRSVIDPTRMAQGIMTGIGFLGAGVIMRDGMSIRGLTTAASIWITAALGILAGVGLYSLVIIGTTMTLLALSVFRWLEGSVIPSCYYANLEVVYQLKAAQNESDFRSCIESAGISLYGVTINQDNVREELTYKVTLRSHASRNVATMMEKFRHDQIIKRITLIPAQ